MTTSGPPRIQGRLFRWDKLTEVIELNWQYFNPGDDTNAVDSIHDFIQLHTNINDDRPILPHFATFIQEQLHLSVHFQQALLYDQNSMLSSPYILFPTSLNHPTTQEPIFVLVEKDDDNEWIPINFLPEGALHSNPKLRNLPPLDNLPSSSIFTSQDFHVNRPSLDRRTFTSNELTVLFKTFYDDFPSKNQELSTSLLQYFQNYPYDELSIAFHQAFEKACDRVAQNPRELAPYLSVPPLPQGKYPEPRSRSKHEYTPIPPCQIAYLLPIRVIDPNPIIADFAILFTKKLPKNSSQDNPFTPSKILTIPRAYSNARLLCHVDETWLAKSFHQLYSSAHLYKRNPRSPFFPQTPTTYTGHDIYAPDCINTTNTPVSSTQNAEIKLYTPQTRSRANIDRYDDEESNFRHILEDISHVDVPQSQNRPESPLQTKAGRVSALSRPEGKPNNPLLPTPPPPKQTVPFTASTNIMTEPQTPTPAELFTPTQTSAQRLSPTAVPFTQPSHSREDVDGVQTLSLTKTISTQPQLTLIHQSHLISSSNPPSPSPTLIPQNTSETALQFVPTSANPQSSHPSPSQQSQSRASFTPSHSFTTHTPPPAISPSSNRPHSSVSAPHSSAADVAFIASNPAIVTEVLQTAWWVYLQIQQTADLISNDLLDPILLEDNANGDDFQQIELNEQCLQQLVSDQGSFSSFPYTYPYSATVPTAPFPYGSQYFHQYPSKQIVHPPQNLTSPTSVTTASFNLLEQHSLTHSPSLSSVIPPTPTQPTAPLANTNCSTPRAVYAGDLPAESPTQNEGDILRVSPPKEEPNQLSIHSQQSNTSTVHTELPSERPPILRQDSQISTTSQPPLLKSPGFEPKTYPRNDMDNTPHQFTTSNTSQQPPTLSRGRGKKNDRNEWSVRSERGYRRNRHYDTRYPQDRQFGGRYSDQDGFRYSNPNDNYQDSYPVFEGKYSRHDNRGHGREEKRPRRDEWMDNYSYGGPDGKQGGY
ncbi:hypothetical protein BLNAU_11881 [Blattamonas nauphoetae]|uniref:DUF3825 domain-containing protein n=1 Tax=Blattamonas nauphoetae TaxID=2049346 RepID=A0ABQ9XRM4_9EUKA|nr:hypothetical protein BLNAU_11881 [Blattamonas nauphoetae]